MNASSSHRKIQSSPMARTTPGARLGGSALALARRSFLPSLDLLSQFNDTPLTRSRLAP
jgi:hypothetical protein